MKWTESIIDTNEGRRRAIEPLIISASRATDIPAFHAPWLLRRLDAGYCLWKNPFNPASSQYASFKKTRLIVFWSKNPAPLLPYLARIEARGLKFYFHFTINDYRAEGLEPGLPPLAERIATFKELSERFGPERVIWRYDPIIFGPNLGGEATFARIAELGRELAPYTTKLVFSFVDFYLKTKRNLWRINPAFRAPDKDEAARLAQALATRFTSLSVESCAEYLAPRGIKRSSCIDPALAVKLCPDLAAWLPVNKKRSIQLSLMENPVGEFADPGREKLCGCIPARDIGAYDTCGHLCAYCYACASGALARARMEALDENSESLGGMR